MLRLIFRGIGRDTDAIGNLFQFAVAEENTTPLVRGDIQRAFSSAASLLLSAGQAGVRMVGEDLA